MFNMPAKVVGGALNNLFFPSFSKIQEDNRQIWFKLTSEMVEVMGGEKSQGYRMFEELFISGFIAIHKERNQVSSNSFNASIALSFVYF